MVDTSPLERVTRIKAEPIDVVDVVCVPVDVVLDELALPSADVEFAENVGSPVGEDDDAVTEVDVSLLLETEVVLDEAEESLDELCEEETEVVAVRVLDVEVVSPLVNAPSRTLWAGKVALADINMEMDSKAET